MYALLGGTFDPIHQGHLQTALGCAHALGCRVHLLPSARSPLKQRTHVDDRARLMMLQAAIAPHSELALDLSDMERPAPSYAIDTLMRLRVQQPQAPLVWIMGEDSLQHLHHWKDWQQLADCAHLLIVNRPESPVSLAPVVAQWLASVEADSRLLTLTIDGDNQLQCRPHGMVARLNLSPQLYSSTELRQQLAARPTHCPPGLPQSVWQLIQTHHWYTAASARHEAL